MRVPGWYTAGNDEKWKDYSKRGDEKETAPKSKCWPELYINRNFGLWKIWNFFSNHSAKILFDFWNYETVLKNSNTMGRFNGKSVIVTGSSNGIGAATALQFAKEGAQVTITGRKVENLEVSLENIMFFFIFQQAAPIWISPWT